jgi:hypothetical protein
LEQAPPFLHHLLFILLQSSEEDAAVASAGAESNLAGSDSHIAPGTCFPLLCSHASWILISPHSFYCLILIFRTSASTELYCFPKKPTHVGVLSVYLCTLVEWLIGNNHGPLYWIWKKSGIAWTRDWVCCLFCRFNFVYFVKISMIIVWSLIFTCRCSPGRSKYWNT